MSEVKRGYIVAAGEGLPGGVAGVMATADSTGGTLTVIRSRVQAGPPRHVHDREDECLYVLNGILTVECGTQTWQAGPHSFVFLPRGLPHTFRASRRPVDVLLIAVPGGIEHYFREINAATDGERQHRIGEQYGIRVV